MIKKCRKVYDKVLALDIINKFKIDKNRIEKSKKLFLNPKT